MKQIKNYKKNITEKSAAYFSRTNMNIIGSITGNNNTILDVGCGSAMTDKELKHLGLANYVVGIEANSDAAEAAKKNIDEVICCNAADAELPFNNFFDYVIFSHILEHLYDPLSVLKKIEKTLKEDGKLIVALPNIKYWRIMRDLIFLDKWEYQEAGILDNDHVRFFTMKSAKRLLEDAGYEVAKNWFCVHGRKQGLFDFLTGRVFQGFLGGELYIIAKKKSKV